MKNPHTLPALRRLYAGAERTLTSPRMTPKHPTKLYDKLACMPGVELTEPLPGDELKPAERAAIVLRLIHDTLNRAELEAAQEWFGAATEGVTP